MTYTAEQRQTLREPVEIDARKAVPKSWRDAALAKTGGACARLDCDATAGLEFDHIIPLALGGKHRSDNIQPLCRPHHRIKTDRDVAMIAKAKAQAGETGQYARRQKRGGSMIPAHKDGLKSRGFDKSKTRKFNGQTVPRENGR